MKKKLVETKTKKEQPFIITVSLGGKVLKGQGATALEALRAIAKPEKIVTKGIITISQGKLKKELLLLPPKMKRIFYPNAQPVLIKWLAQGLK